MNAAEEVTMLWLNLQDYFVMPGVKYGRHEIDLLGLKLSKGAGLVEDRVQVEVSVSSSPFCTNLADEDYKSAAESFVRRKFDAVTAKVEELFGPNYSRWRVIGKLGGGDREVRIQTARCEELNVRVFQFKNVVKDTLRLVAATGARPAGNTGQLLHILNSLQLFNPIAES